MTTINPKRGEVWRVQLEPTRGSEQSKTRPVVVLSLPHAGRATLRLCAPVMTALPVHAALFWCVELQPTAANGLTKESTADAAQTRALDVVRFEARLGKVRPDELELIADALIQCVKRPPTASPTPK
jgi:mRNA interferase MazF